MSKKKLAEANLVKVDKNLPEDEKDTVFVASKLKPTLRPKKRKQKRPTSGIDRIRILAKRQKSVDVNARFNYVDHSTEGTYTVKVPERRHIVAMIRRKKPNIKPRALQAAVTKKFADFILVELQKFYLKQKSGTDKMLVPDTSKGELRKIG